MHVSCCDEFRSNRRWNWLEHSELLYRLWKRDSQHTRVGKIFLTALLVFPTISPSNCFIARENNGEAEFKSTRWMDWYIFGWILILTANLLFLKSLPRCLVWFVVAYRIIDSVTYRAYFVFFKSSWKPWRDSRRSLGIAIANLYEVVVGYGTLYVLSAEVFNSKCEVLYGWWNAFYFSLVTITTLGYGDYAPQGFTAQLLVICELITGIMFLVFIIPSLVSLLNESGGSGGSYPAADIEEKVRKRAYKRYEERGRVDGQALDDWLKSEKESSGSGESYLATDVEDQVRKRAYELYEERGQVDGPAEKNWLDAEKEILPRESWNRLKALFGCRPR